MKNLRGQSLFEVVVILGVAALIVTGIVGLSTSAVGTSSSNSNRAIANRYAQEGSEWIRQTRDDSFSTLKSNVNQNVNWCMNSLPPTYTGLCSSSSRISGTIFRRDVIWVACANSGANVSCSSPNIDSVSYTVRVTWSDNNGEHTSEVSSRLTDWK